MLLGLARAGSPPHQVGASSGIANIGGPRAAVPAMVLVGVTLDRAPAPTTNRGLADFRIALATEFLLQLLGAGLLFRRMKRTRAPRSPDGADNDLYNQKPAPTGRDHPR